MKSLDLIKKKVIYARTSQATYTSVAVEFPIGIKEAVSLIAVHWTIERPLGAVQGEHLFLAALSENPEHELTPPVGVAEMQGNLSLYGMASWLGVSSAVGDGRTQDTSIGTIIVPLYGILRPKRQIAVFGNVASTGVTGIRGEIYYTEERPPLEVVNAISRRSGKYRRT